MDAQAREYTVRDRVRTQLRTDDDRLVRSVVTRTAMFVVAILLLELGFIASYAGAPAGATLPGQGTGNVFQPPLHQSPTEAAIRRADHPATSQTPSPLYGLGYEVVGGR